MPDYQYHHMAAFYEWADAVEFSEVMTARTLQCFAERGVSGGAPACDLACGTGTLALALARAGYRMTGVDVSPAMLRLARSKAREAGVRVQWRRADMRAFALPNPVDAITCYYDSVNHLLTQRDVSAMLKRVYAALRPGGLFCFDANTLFCFRAFWKGLVHKMEHAGSVQFIEGTFSERTGRASATVTGFVPAGRNRYRKFVERVDERYYSSAVWRRLLRRAGFARVRVEPFDPWDHGGAERMKWFLTAVRPA